MFHRHRHTAEKLQLFLQPKIFYILQNQTFLLYITYIVIKGHCCYIKTFVDLYLARWIGCYIYKNYVEYGVPKILCRTTTISLRVSETATKALVS